jgi:hypothetical protein
MVTADTLAVFGCWPNRARHETAAAIWTDIVKRAVDTARAEGAFITANTRLLGIGWQIAVAQFTVGT